MTNFIVFRLTRPGHEPTIYVFRGEHANHYTIVAVMNKRKRKKNNMQNTTRKTKTLATQTPLKPGVNICDPDRLAVPTLHVKPVVWLLKTRTSSDIEIALDTSICKQNK